MPVPTNIWLPRRTSCPSSTSAALPVKTVMLYVQAGNVVVENHTDAAFEVRLVQIDGRQVAAMKVQQMAVIDGSALPHGVLLVVANNGTSQITKKVIL